MQAETVAFPGIGNVGVGRRERPPSHVLPHCPQFLSLSNIPDTPFLTWFSVNVRGGNSLMRVTSLNVLGAENVIRLPGSNPGTVPVLILGNHGGLCWSYNQATSECH